VARSGARSGARGGQRAGREAAPSARDADRIIDAASDADRIIDAALASIAADGWRRLSLAAIAAEAGLPVLRVYRAFRSKQAILDGFLERIDEAVLAEAPAAEADEHPRDRVFDLLMRRFDALRPHKPVIEALRRELPSDPLTALCLGTRLLRSIRWILDAADIATGGLSGIVAVRLTGAAYLSAMRVWRGDDSPDLARTMAALDVRLRRIERWLTPLHHPPRAGAEPAAA
jgi:AcrR family transcriptional regulator